MQYIHAHVAVDEAYAQHGLLHICMNADFGIQHVMST